MLEDQKTLDNYLTAYGTLLGKQAQENLQPLHDPATQKNHPMIRTLLRKPYPAQAVTITGGVKCLDVNKSLFLVSEMGTGKTVMGMSIVHCHAKGKPSRTLVMCPPQLLRKWKREIEETIPKCYVKIITESSDLLEMATYGPPRCSEWYIIGRDKAKLGPGRKPAAIPRVEAYETQVRTEDGGVEVIKKRGPILHCPQCGAKLFKVGGKDDGRPLTMDDLEKTWQTCPAKNENEKVCGSTLWQHIRKPDRFEPAKFIHKKLGKWFDYLIADECHELGKSESAQGQALGSLAASSRRVIAMTGTLIGGYAEHLRPILFRLAPRSLRAEGFTWEEGMPFNERYGRIETVIRESGGGGGEDNRQSRGSKSSKQKYCRPGIMPTLFGRHLMGNAVFMGLEQMNEALPTLREFVVPVEMDPELKLAYKDVEETLKAEVRQMMIRRDKRLLGTMLQTLLAYPDHPYGWGDVGYKEHGTLIKVCTPPKLDMLTIRPKERKLIDICQSEYALGRQVWVYVQLNGERNVQGRLARMLEDAGLRTKILEAKVKPIDREEWIDKNCAEIDVVVSHPQLVQTGLDLFSKTYLGHNFSTLVFYETGYVLPTMRQASRRAWRLQQPKECKVYYLYYEKTMQQRAMELMGKKLLAAEALEGKFSSEGLVAMAGDDGIEMAMAKSLAENMDESTDRSWAGALGESEGTRVASRKRNAKRQTLVVE